MSPLKRRVAIIVLAFAASLLTAVVLGGSISRTAVLVGFAVLAAMGVGLDVARTVRQRRQLVRELRRRAFGAPL